MNTKENRVAILNELEAVRHQVHQELGYTPGDEHVYVYTTECEAPLGKATFTVRADNEEDAYYKAYKVAKEHPLASGDLRLTASSKQQVWGIYFCPQRSRGKIFKYFTTTYSARHAYLELQDELKLTDTVIGVYHVKEV